LPRASAAATFGSGDGPPSPALPAWHDFDKGEIGSTCAAAGGAGVPVCAAPCAQTMNAPRSAALTAQAPRVACVNAVRRAMP
jgi:hypothetical protein